MIKTVHDDVWVFDAEWSPDPRAGRLLYDLGRELSDEGVVLEMFRQAGATPEKPAPFLKPVMCRVRSIVTLIRRVTANGIVLRLLSLPRNPGDLEADILRTFLEGVGKKKPQLVGFNSLGADLRIFLQRAVVNGIEVGSFLQRPEKPWLGADYFAKDNDYHVDLYSLLNGWGAGGPSLHQIATLSGIPGKLDCDGEQVYRLSLEGRLGEIVAYNECDVLTTYLVWLRCIYVSGHISAEEYKTEQSELRRLIVDEHTAGRGEHLMRFLDRWDGLKKHLEEHES
jgi:predicted PolB exonuclease-like 3'-5' exonuclease